MKPTKGLLERVAARVLADAAFILAEPLAKEPPTAQAWLATGARIAFSGPWRGFVEIWAPDEVARLLAANILGQETDDPDVDETLLDAMLETLNVICGNLLAELAGREPMFQLGSPRPCRELVPFSDKDPGVDAWLEAEGHPLLVRMRVLEPETQAA